MKACRKHIDRKDHHTNYYFDCKRLKLRKRKFGLRIRLVNKRKAVLTLKFPAKGHHSSMKSLKVRHEFEEPIRMQSAQAIILGKKKVIELKAQPIKVLKKAFPRNHLELIYPLGAVKTVRTIAKLPKVKIELDSFQMFGKKFYELEVETEKPKSADKAIRNLLRENKIPYHPITKSKLRRFLEMWKRTREI